MKIFTRGLLCAFLMSACGGGAGSASTSSATSADGQWTELLKGAWELTPGQETYKCVRKTLDQDLYIHAFRAISPVGTHHTVLSVGAPNGDDGIAPCSAVGFGNNMIFGSGVGTHDITFPDGLALHVPAGQQLVSNLHLFNTSTDALTGESGNEVILKSPDETTDLIDNMLAGPVLFSIPPNGTSGPSVISGDCTMDADVNIIAVQPHMHKLGIHQTIVAKTANGDVMLHDGDYTFDEQVYYMVSPQVALSKGDKVHIECTYDNTGTSAVTFGESTNNEMCFTSVYRYPASGNAHLTCSR